MPSESLEHYKERLTEVEQLLEAHEALVKFRKAEAAAAGIAAGDLAAALTAVTHLVSDVGVGRPKEVHALNGAAIALLSGHLQGFITDIHAECASKILHGKVKDLATVVSASPTRGNPNERNINNLFATLGFPDILDNISWQAVSNDALKRNLKEFNELRNRIVHGKSEHVRKASVTRYMKLWKSFGARLDEKLRTEITQLTGAAPW